MCRREGEGESVTSAWLDSGGPLSASRFTCNISDHYHVTSNGSTNQHLTHSISIHNATMQLAQDCPVNQSSNNPFQLTNTLHTHCTSRHNATTVSSSLKPQHKNSTHEPQKELNNEPKGTHNIVDPKNKNKTAHSLSNIKKTVFLLTRGILLISTKKELTEKQTPPRFPYYDALSRLVSSRDSQPKEIGWNISFRALHHRHHHQHMHTDQHEILHLAFPEFGWFEHHRYECHISHIFMSSGPQSAWAVEPERVSRPHYKQYQT